jgi:hypothetical protein
MGHAHETPTQGLNDQKKKDQKPGACSQERYTTVELAGGGSVMQGRQAGLIPARSRAGVIFL